MEFVINKIVSDYPGFNPNRLDEKSKFRSFAKHVANQNQDDTFKAVSLIVDHFHDPHLQIINPGSQIKDDSSLCNERLLLTNNYLTSKKLKGYEGYWINDYKNCVIGLRKTKGTDRYQAIVIENSLGKLQPGVILAKMAQKRNGKYLTDLRSVFTGSRFFVNTIFRSDTVFNTGSDGKWRKINHYHSSYLNQIDSVSFLAQGKLIDNNNYLITIPSCIGINAKILDSIQRSDSAIISRTPNLIIDIRRNTGGKSAVLYPLLPWIYTNPIRRISASTYSTPTRISQLQQQLEKGLQNAIYDSTDSVKISDWISKLKKNDGKFVYRGEDTFYYPEIRTNPKNVAIIVDYACQSAAELLLLTYIQSKKVKLFGECTAGAVDYLDFYPIETPKNKFSLYLATSKRNFPPGEEIDGKGICPDVYLDDNNNDWIKTITHHYESN